MRPLQNTKPLWEPKYTPKYTLNPLPKPKYEKKYEKYQKSGVFVIFSYIFCILVSGEDSGCILGCILDFRGVLYFAGGAGTRKVRIFKASRFSALFACCYYYYYYYYYYDYHHSRDPDVLKTLQDSELIRRSVLSTPPRLTTLWTLLWEEECLQLPGKWRQDKVRPR